MELAILRDNGEVATFNAYRVQHDNSRGPYKGGLRFHPDVDIDDVRRWGGAGRGAGRGPVGLRGFPFPVVCWLGHKVALA